MENEQQINAQVTVDCIKAESDFTETIYHNICTGEVSVVPTGVVDYMLGIPLIILAGVGALIGLGFLGVLVKEWFLDR